MFESGILDFFVLLGPGPKEVSRQYGVLTGETREVRFPVVLSILNFLVLNKGFYLEKKITSTSKEGPIKNE